MTAPARRLLHTRQVVCTGHLRDDGCFDVEATMQDISPRGTAMFFTEVAPGGFIHSMRLVVTIDRELVIREVSAQTETGPTPHCADSNERYKLLVGVHIGAGFTKKVRALLGGTQGCTHLNELWGPLATTAFQTRFALERETRALRPAQHGTGPLPRPAIADTCQAYRSDGQAMQIIWPAHRRAA